MPRVTGVHPRGHSPALPRQAHSVNSMTALANLSPTFWMNGGTVHLEVWGGDGLCSPSSEQHSFTQGFSGSHGWSGGEN